MEQTIDDFVAIECGLCVDCYFDTRGCTGYSWPNIVDELDQKYGECSKPITHCYQLITKENE